ncbi:hypothetical protein KAFR_0A06580 [Kazachstania africana CBS 2517]|uniref:Uncharacterized protein n=1 Tax=Kazachstania africana (strain ATCC 22294 / BCRC 22015 / CBS 2517 / CECT 1963 / NBRC 1671 / NRRL Y-8276) TaxID=1071382 RepID=H2ANZ3_KAZAF|nr:hypothetical protein KAFR_0A06580 [Kazachstania africana CBS 2517]CCF56093.1 hypothetical protein KAFR_0A06580 [Kazachstania africana CBS 2517]
MTNKFVKILLRFTTTDEPICRNLIDQFTQKLKMSAKFWEEHLFYQINNVIQLPDSIELQLKCQILNSEKIDYLLRKPLENVTGNKYSICFNIVQKLQINIDISLFREVTLENITTTFNQYFVSLLASQLELKFPFVFSKLARSRLKAQEDDLSPLSQCIIGSAALLPNLLMTMQRDTTATIVYQLLAGGGKANFINFHFA